MASLDNGLVALSELLVDSVVGDLTPREAPVLEVVGLLVVRENIGVEREDVVVDAGGRLGGIAAVPPRVVLRVLSVAESVRDVRVLLLAVVLDDGRLFSSASPFAPSLAVLRAEDEVGRVGGLLMVLPGDVREDIPLDLVVEGEAGIFVATFNRDEGVEGFFVSSCFEAGFAPAAVRLSIFLKCALHFI